MLQNAPASAYKVYALWKFRKELDSRKGNLVETLEWKKTKTQIVGKESVECESSMIQKLHRKWEQFTLRAGTDALKELKSVNCLDQLIVSVRRGDPPSKS